MCSKNEKLQTLPDVIDIILDDRMLSYLFNSYYTSPNSLIEPAIKNLLPFERMEDCPIVKSYELYIKPEALKVFYNTDFSVTKKSIFHKDLEKMRDAFYIKKIRTSIPQSESIEYVLGQRGAIGDLPPKDAPARNRLTKIYKLFAIDSKKNESMDKTFFLEKEIHDKIRKNEWRVRSSDAIIIIFSLINDFLISGDMASYAKLAKLNVIVHRGLPIYSLKD
jgi:hypothetical protein